MESPSMTRAAENARLSPGAVSLQLRNLAEELHTELFVRNGRKLNPTPAAWRLAEHTKALVRLTSQIKQEFETDLSADTRPFQFSTGVTTLIYQLGKRLRQLRKQYPKAEIRVRVNPTEETIAGLQSRRFDLGLVTLPVPEEVLKIMPLFEEELLVLRHANKRVRGGRIGILRPADLAGVPFLLYPKRSNLRQIIDRNFKDMGVTPHVVMEADDTEAIKRLVESGFGYSVLPEHALRPGTGGFFQTFRIEGRRIHRVLALATVRTDYPRKLTDAIAHSLQAMLKDLDGRQLNRLASNC
jgi:DNA-binding transcriptional LysR family regulator